LKWTEGKTYSSIANDYADFTVKHYGKATVIFDGYGGGPNTKDHTHQRRSQSRIANKVNISEAICRKKEDFLSNNENKQALIHLVSTSMRERLPCHTS
jgi:hypothetical protein